jgi:phytol kinase
VNRVNPWVGIALVVVLLLGMLALLRWVRARWAPHPELLRKMAHVGLGLASLSFPWLFDEAWPVVLIGALALTTLLALRYVPALRSGVGGVVNGVDRSSGGDLYFPVAATGLFLLARGDPVLFSVPILTLAFADAVAALVGVFYGRFRYDGAEGKKSLEGSAAFILVAFLATHVPLLLFTQTGRAESLLIGLTFGVLVMLLEAVAWRGLDNLFIPFGGFLLLRSSLALDAPALTVRLAITVAMLVLVLLLRKRRTLTDSAILGGVLVGYVAWSVGGWHWLLPPLVLFLAYTLLWPRSAQIRERPHDMVALVSVTSCGMLWLLLATVMRRPDFYYPYTLTFAANLCFIGITWWRDYRRSAAPWRGVVASAAVAWVAFLTPYIVVEGASRAALVAALHGFVALTVAGGFFTLVVPNLHNRPSRDFPWARQALLGLGASGLGLFLVDVSTRP